MKRVLILGAGFSHAVGKLPLQKELLSSIIDIREKIESHAKLISHWEQINSFVNYIGNILRTKQGCHSNLLEKFELIMSIIDLNTRLDFNILTHFNNKLGTLFNQKTIFEQYSLSELKEVRNSINIFLKILLNSENTDISLLNKFYSNFIDSYDDTQIITFNYDLILEKYFYTQNSWFPHDGYGINLKKSIKSNYLGKKSKYIIHKPHGSINFSNPEIFEFSLITSDFNENEYFPKYFLGTNSVTSNHYKKDCLTSNASFIKTFDSEFLSRIWFNTAKAISEADEIIFIGYSLPKEDSATQTLFNITDFSKKSIKIIDPWPFDTKKRLMINKTVAEKNIELISDKLEEYLCKP